MALNRWIGMGRLTKDPELRRTGNGTAVASFTIAVERNRKTNGGERETDFIDVVAWRQTAEFVDRYFEKGRMAVVEGRLQFREYTDREGNKRKVTEVIAENVYFGDSKKDRDGGSHHNVPTSSDDCTEDLQDLGFAEDFDLPF